MLKQTKLLACGLACGLLMMLSARSASADGTPCNQPAPSCCAAPACCPKPCIEYRHWGLPLHCCDCCCKEPIKAVLKVKDPCTCCVVDVPVCLPACCTGDPTICDRCGLFDRTVVEYSYCCGVRVKVTFRHDGDLIVTYVHA